MFDGGVSGVKMGGGWGNIVSVYGGRLVLEYCC